MNKSGNDSAEINKIKTKIIENLTGFIPEYAKESDRAAAILVAARLDELLFQLLSGFMVPDATRDDELLKSDRALGTFSSRIHAAYRLGLIDAELARSLNLFRRLRNDCAHQTVGVSFDLPPGRDRIRELARPYEGAPVFARLKNVVRDMSSSAAKSDEAVTLYAVASMLLYTLEWAVSSVEQVSAKHAAGLLPTNWSEL